MTQTKCFDLSVYLVTDPVMAAASGLVETVAAAVAGGATLVQLRDKDASTRGLISAAKALMDLLNPLGIPLIINDRADVALATGAAGVHLGQDDMPADIARRLMGPGPIIGISASNADHLAAADPDVVDYVGIGHIFATATKPKALPPLGIEGFRDLRERTSLPVVAIGGIDPDTAGPVVAAGADGVAVVSGILRAPDPQAAATQYALAVAAARFSHSRTGGNR